MTSTSFNALQARIDAANAAGGGTVRVGAGTITVPVGSELVVKAGVKIVGAGRGKTTLKMAASQSVDKYVVRIAGNDTALEALTVDGNRTNQTNSTHGVGMTTMYNRFTMRDMRIVSTYSQGYVHVVADGDVHGWYWQDVVFEDIGASGIILAGNSTTPQTVPLGAFTGIHVISYGQRVTLYQAALTLYWPVLIDSLYLYGTSGTAIALFNAGSANSAVTNYHWKRNGASASGGPDKASCEIQHGNEIA